MVTQRPVVDTVADSPSQDHVILVVDDDPGIVGFLQLALADEGYRVRAAGNGKEALSSIAEIRPDLILLDMNMPVMDGWEFCHQLRCRGAELDSIPIVVMTASREATSRSGEIGAQGFLGKPFDLELLFQTVASLLSSS